LSNGLSYLVIDAEYAGDPVRFEALDALDVIHIIDQDDDVCPFNLTIRVLILFSQG
jgi:hypothetical protein